VDLALLAAVGLFCVVTGVNDGAAMSAGAARIAMSSVVFNLALLTAGLVVVPLVHSQVAVTLAQRLTGSGGLDAAAVLIVIGSTILVVGWLSHRGQPTSLTLALIGALAGAAVGVGDRPDGWIVAQVLGIAALAPFVAGGLAVVITNVAALLTVPGSRAAVIRWGHRITLVGQAGAYAANDGQKLLAVAVLAMPAMFDLHEPSPLPLLALAVLFALGTLAGLRRVSRTLAEGLVPVRPIGTVIAGCSASGTVLVSAAVGAPISMTQALAGGLIGSGSIARYRSVRWRAALQLLQAWAVTLPAAFGLAALLAWLR
jgi:inorganic phosphate transporter, PiT family